MGHFGSDDHIRDAVLSAAEIEQTVAEYKDLIGEMVGAAREHKLRCDTPGCPGQTVIHALAEIIKKGPDMSLTALGLCITFLATGETFTLPADHPLEDQELKEMLHGVLGETGLLGESGPES